MRRRDEKLVRFLHDGAHELDLRLARLLAPLRELLVGHPFFSTWPTIHARCHCFAPRDALSNTGRDALERESINGPERLERPRQDLHTQRARHATGEPFDGGRVQDDRSQLSKRVPAHAWRTRTVHPKEDGDPEA